MGIQIDGRYLMEHDLDYLLNDLELRLNGNVRKITLNKLKKVIKEYYKNEMFPGKRLAMPLDTVNDLFKYTNNIHGADIDFKLFDTISRKDVAKIEKDIDFLYKIFATIENEIVLISSMKKYGMSTSLINKELRGKFSIDKK